MSDHGAEPDPMDKAYAQAEAVLSDEAARAARRARVLAAVAGEAATPGGSAAPVRRSAWGRGGWLVAAGVAGLGVFLATQVYLPATIQRPTPRPPATTTAPAVASSATPATAAPPTAAPKAKSLRTATARTPGPTARLAAPKLAAPPPAPVASEPPAAAPPRTSAMSASRAVPEAAAAPSAEVSEIVTTGSRIASPNLSASLRSAPGAPTDPAARLRALAAAGRTADVAALLARGVAVDAPDEEGETALMKAVQGDHPAAAALLLRHGASLDRRNRAEVSARDMAMSVGDAKLNQALGLGP